MRETTRLGGPKKSANINYFIYQGSIVTQAGGKIDSAKFYYCEKSEKFA
jgi:hypothetical protein